MEEYVLHGRAGWGSAIVELQLAWYGLPFRLEEAGDLLDSEEARARLRPLNPVAQIPTLVLPGGAVMTESAAITLHLADRTGRDDLVPAPRSPERAGFLRWLVFLVANVYPTFTYADVPGRFVTDEAAAAGFRREVDAYAKKLWGAVHDAAGEPFFLGQRLSAIDLYLVVMSRWRPGPAWFERHAPRLAAAAQRAAAHPLLAPVVARHFPAAG